MILQGGRKSAFLFDRKSARAGSQPDLAGSAFRAALVKELRSVWFQV